MGDRNVVVGRFHAFSGCLFYQRLAVGIESKTPEQNCSAKLRIRIGQIVNDNDEWAIEPIQTLAAIVNLENIFLQTEVLKLRNRLWILHDVIPGRFGNNSDE